MTDFPLFDSGISSFNYEGIDKEGSLPADKKLQIRIPHNGWQKEVN